MTTKRSRSKKPQLKRRALSAFARELLHEWRRLKLPLNAASVIVGVSGGSDSVSLLLALDELLKSGKLELTLIVAHLNHQLRLTSQADARWVSRLAKELGYQKSIGSVAVKPIAQRTGDNLEQAARRARYDFLARTARRNRAQIILTAHTMNDQAETVLLNLLRGSGLDGLGGIEPVRIMERSRVLLARPLLSWATREHTMSYCEARDIDIRNDEMNQDEKFARVRVRKRLLPLMQSFNPKLIETLARTAEVLREDNRALDDAAERLLDLSIDRDERPGGGIGCPPLRMDLLVLARTALRRRVLRQWLKQCRGDLRRLERAHIVAVERLLSGNRGGRMVELPGTGAVHRRRAWLEFVA